MSKEVSFYEYTQLSEHDQCDMVFRTGEFVDSTEIASNRYVLYKLYNFYVEVLYDSQTNSIKAISSFLSAKNY